MMSYIKQPHFTVNGLSLAGPGMDLLHPAVGYPGEHRGACTGGLLHTQGLHLVAHPFVQPISPPPTSQVPSPAAGPVPQFPLPQVWFKNRRAKCRQQQQQSSGQAKSRPPKKKSSPTRDAAAAAADIGAPGPYTPPPSAPAGTPSSAGATVSIWSPASISPVPDPLAASATPGLPRSAPFPAAYGQSAAYGQGYAGSGAYFGGLDCGSYLSPMHPQLAPPGAALSPLAAPMGGHLAGSPAGLAAQGYGGAGLGFGAVDCLEYKEPAGSWKLNFNTDCLDYKDQSSWKFQVL
ncbi:OTX5 protein, partial [Alopecoenas beccarii]|nr:OTX5 protein [Alopecoenas beccarii]